MTLSHPESGVIFYSNLSSNFALSSYSTTRGSQYHYYFFQRLSKKQKNKVQMRCKAERPIHSLKENVILTWYYFQFINFSKDFVKFLAGVQQGIIKVCTSRCTTKFLVLTPQAQDPADQPPPLTHQNRDTGSLIPDKC